MGLFKRRRRRKVKPFKILLKFLSNLEKSSNALADVRHANYRNRKRGRSGYLYIGKIQQGYKVGKTIRAPRHRFREHNSDSRYGFFTPLSHFHVNNVCRAERILLQRLKQYGSPVIGREAFSHHVPALTVFSKFRAQLDGTYAEALRKKKEKQQLKRNQWIRDTSEKYRVLIPKLTATTATTLTALVYFSMWIAPLTTCVILLFGCWVYLRVQKAIAECRTAESKQNETPSIKSELSDYETSPYALKSSVW